MKRKTIIYLLLCVCLLGMTTQASAQGASDIYLVKVNASDGQWNLGTPMKITLRKGYNNQPYFVSSAPDGTALLYSSQDGKQTDIYRYTIKTKETTQLTSTPESEYSPTPMQDGKSFSVIQQINTEGPEKGAQKLMAFPIGGKGEASILFYEKEKLVGYHAWITKNRVAMFILGEPHTLQLIDLNTGKARVAAKDIGRSIFKVPGKQAVSFTQYEGNKDGVIKSVDTTNLNITSLAPMKKGSEYYCWTRGGILLTAVGAKLFRCKPGTKTGSLWTETADFSGSGIGKITRLAVDGKTGWLALVSGN
ncbi:MAG: hypothetical protein GY940_47955 [bacterium]|nr:hypothetical protein [bacterium]